MARFRPALLTFNRGRISRLGLARTDLDRTSLSAETQTNWMPRTLGSMMLRPGLGYLHNTLDDKVCRQIPFVFSKDDTALLEVTSSSLRVSVDDSIVTRAASTASVTNGDFSSSALTGWTDADEVGSTSEWVTGNYLGLTGTRYARAIRRQSVTSAAGTHGLNVVVNRGRPILKIGSSAGQDDYFEEATLRPGDYSLAVVSTGDFHIELSANTEYASLIESVSVESSGDMNIPTPWDEADLDKLRWKQSQDVVFVSAMGYQQRRIERYSTESWACVNYEPEDGPFRTINISNKRLTPSGLSGSITLACDQPFFKSGHAGALFEVTSVGQEVEGTFTGADQWTDSIRVSGVGESRIFDILIDSHTSASVTLRVQRSVGEEGSWANVSGLSWTSTIDTSHDDALDNQIIFYRIGVGTTDYGTTSTSETFSAELSYASGGITGIARVTAVSGATESSAVVLTSFGSTAASELWSEGSWSDYRGWPSAVALHEGRLMWAGKGRLFGSVSDAFESFDDDVEGDSGPINRTIGEGPVDNIEWLLSLTRLLVGSQGQEYQAKTSSLEEPLTPTNFSLRDISTQGSNGVQAVKVDQRAVFVQSGGTRIMETGAVQSGLELQTVDRTILVPEIGEPSVVRMVVQRQPDTRIHCVRSDGTVGVLITDPAENVLCWIDVETDGVVEEAVVLPGDIEDKVYYVVQRDVNGSTVRFLERWALESEARGGTTNKIADAFVVQNSSSTTTVSGGSHLIGETVTCWGNGKDLGTYTVSTDGDFTASEASTQFIYGLKYTGLYISSKLAYAAQGGTALTQRKMIDHLGIIAADTHAQGLQFGTSTGNLDPMPVVERGVATSSDAIWSAKDDDPFIFPGKWDTDSRLVLLAEAPRPVTILAGILSMETKEK